MWKYLEGVKQRQRHKSHVLQAAPCCYAWHRALHHALLTRCPAQRARARDCNACSQTESNTCAAGRTDLCCSRNMHPPGRVASKQTHLKGPAFSGSLKVFCCSSNWPDTRTLARYSPSCFATCRCNRQQQSYITCTPNSPLPSHRPRATFLNSPQQRLPVGRPAATGGCTRHHV